MHNRIFQAAFGWPALFVPFLLSAQISGKVMDENGSPLPYATVYVRNTSNGTVANAEGVYHLNLSQGQQEIVFQYIGYKTKIEGVNAGKRPIVLNIRLEPSSLELKEVVISSEDPAVRIMKEVIAKRKYYKNQVKQYNCDVYIKGFYKLTDTPKKILGEEVGNMGGILDTNRAGVIYLSESVSKVYFQTPPTRKKEVMISSKVSGDQKGFSLNRATFTEFDLYEEKLDVGREILSPLADNAFNYYRFKWLGSYVDINGFTIEKIKVAPQRPTDPCFSGYLYVVDDYWNLSGIDLALTGAAIKQPIIDTLKVQQQFVLMEKPDTWRMLTQLTSFKFSVLGFKVAGFFNGVFSNYNLHPVFDDDIFGKEIFSIDKEAVNRDTAYWQNIRPVPLTLEERSDYRRKDSLEIIWKSKRYLDSLDRKNNRFKFNNLLLGYTWRNSYKNRSISYPGASKWIQFNTIQGWLLDVQPEWKHDSDDYGNRFWRATGDINYGFSEKKLRGWLILKRRFESIRYSTLEFGGGVMTEQFNELRPIGPLVNTEYSLFAERNYLKIYDKSFARVDWTQVPWPGVSLDAFAEWSRRSPLKNHSSFSWRKGNPSRYTLNDPVPALEVIDNFEAPDMFQLGLDLRFHFGQTYSSYPQARVYMDSKWPDITLRYRKAVPNVLGSDADYDFVHMMIRQSDLSWGLFGNGEWSVGGGMFLRKKSLSFMDWYHASGNQTIFGMSQRYSRSFLALPYYAYSTNQPFVEAHYQHHLQGWLMDKIPLLRKLNLKEVFGGGIYYADQASLDPAFKGKLPYWEWNAGFENLGIKPFRILRLDVVGGYFGTQHYRTGVVIGIGLP